MEFFTFADGRPWFALVYLLVVVIGGGAFFAASCQAIARRK